MDKYRKILRVFQYVSLLTALSKVYERVLFDQMYGAFQCKLSLNLSGYLKGHSCCTVLLKITEDWRARLDRREAVAAVAIDLSKAFDSVCHSLLIAKLSAYGLLKRASTLMKAYLCGRKQLVKVDNTFSQWKAVRSGVPQGSLLGPLLFNIYMNDLNHFVQGSSLRLYSDDTTAYASDTSPLVLEYIINSDLQSVCKWFENNYLNINTTKTQAMAIGPVNYEYNINLHNSNIDLNDSLKILGVTLDRKMTFKPYILEQLKKACAKTAALRKLRKFIPQEVMIRLYKAYILPHLEYCSPLLLGISNGLKNKLEDTNYYILRTILNYSRAVSYNFILNKAELQNLDNRRKFQSLVLLFKCLNGQGPQYLSEFFKVLNVNYNLRGSATRLVLPHFNIECKHKSWLYLSTMLWNGLPAGVRGSPTLAVFRRVLHSCLT